MICFALAPLVIEYVRFNYLMQRFPAPVSVPGIPPHHAMYKLDPGGIGVPGQSGPQPLVDFQPVSTLLFLPRPHQKFQLNLIINLMHDFGYHCNYL